MYEVGDLVWYYAAHGKRRYKCTVLEVYILDKKIKIYDFDRGFSFVTSKSCIKKLDKVLPTG